MSFSPALRDEAMPTETAIRIIKDGGIRLKVKRSGMLQFQNFVVKRVSAGMDKSFVELYLDRVLDMKEVERISNETGLPVETQNGRVFPAGFGVKDFVGL